MLTISELHDLLAHREVSAVEVLDAHLRRILEPAGQMARRRWLDRLVVVVLLRLGG